MADDLAHQYMDEHKWVDETLLLKDLSESERLAFQPEYQAAKKNSTTAVVLALFLGGMGAHRFYMGQVGLGVLYLVGAAATAITIIPISAVVALVDTIDRVSEHEES